MRQLKEYLTLKSEERTGFSTLVEAIMNVPKGTYKFKKGSKGRQNVGDKTFVHVDELLSRCPKSKLGRLTHLLYFKSKFWQKELRPSWHVNKLGEMCYFALPTKWIDNALAYQAWRESRGK